MPTKPVKANSKTVEILSRVKQVMHCDIEETVNNLLESGRWILINIIKSPFTQKTMFCFGMLREKSDEISRYYD